MVTVESNGERIVLNAEFPRVEGNVPSVVRLIPVESVESQIGAGIEATVLVVDEPGIVIEPDAIQCDGCVIPLAGEVISEPDTGEDSVRKVLFLYPDMNNPRQAVMVQQLFPTLDIASLVPPKQGGEDVASAENPASIVTGDVRIPLQDGTPQSPDSSAGNPPAMAAVTGGDTSSMASLDLATPESSAGTPETAASSAETGYGSRTHGAPVLTTSLPDCEISLSPVPMDTAWKDEDSSPVTTAHVTVPKAAPPRVNAAVPENPLPSNPQPSSRKEIPAASSSTATTTLPYGQTTPPDTGREMTPETVSPENRMAPDISGSEYSYREAYGSAEEASSGTRSYRNTPHADIAVSSESVAKPLRPAPSTDNRFPEPLRPKAEGTKGNETAPPDKSVNALSAEPARSSSPSRQVVLPPITALTPDGERIEVRIRIQQVETGESGSPVTPETHIVAPTLNPDDSGAVIVQSPDTEPASGSPSRNAIAGSSTTITERAEVPKDNVITVRLIRESRPSPEWSAETEHPAANAEGEERAGEMPSPSTMTFRKPVITPSASVRPNPPETVSRTVDDDGITSSTLTSLPGKTGVVTEREIASTPSSKPEPHFGNGATNTVMSETVKETTNNTRTDRTGSESASPVASRLVTHSNTATSGRTFELPLTGDTLRAAPQSAYTPIPVAPVADEPVVSRPMGNTVPENPDTPRTEATESVSPEFSARNAYGSGKSHRPVETFMPGTARKIHFAAPVETDGEIATPEPNTIDAESILSMEAVTPQAHELNGVSETPPVNEADRSSRAYTVPDGTFSSGDDTAIASGDDIGPQALEETSTTESSPLRFASSEATETIPVRTVSRMHRGDALRHPESRRSAGEGETVSFPVRPETSSSVEEGTETEYIRAVEENAAPAAVDDGFVDVSPQSPMTANPTASKSSPRESGRVRRDGSGLSTEPAGNTEGEETARAGQVKNELASVREARIEKRIHRVESRGEKNRKNGDSPLEFSSTVGTTVSSSSSTTTLNALRPLGNTVSEPFSGEIRRTGSPGAVESESFGENDPEITRATLEMVSTASETKRSSSPKATLRHSESPEFETGILNSVVRQARFMLQSGQSSAAITLDPPSLGKMRLEIVTENSKVTGKIMVESREVQDIIRNNMAELRQSLTQGGLQVESFDVQVGHNGGTDSWARREDMESLAESLRQGMKNAAGTSDVPISGGIRGGRVITGPGYIDMWV